MPTVSKSAQKDSLLPDLKRQTVTDLWSKVENFCTDHPTTCQMRDAALHMAHVQAVALTGALHDWLAEGLEES